MTTIIWDNNVKRALKQKFKALDNDTGKMITDRANTIINKN